MKCPHCGEEMKTRTITMQKKEYKRVLTILFVIGLIPLFVGITLVLISIAECNLNSQQLAVLFTSGRIFAFGKNIHSRRNLDFICNCNSAFTAI